MHRINLFLAILCVLSALCGKSAAQPPRDTTHSPQVVFVTGDNEYGSELSMPMMAQILEKHHGMKTTVLYSENAAGQRDKDGDSIPGLEALRTADLGVFFMRFRELPQDQLDEIVHFAESGRPIIGFRTATHAFKYPGPPNDRWNDEFGRKYLGQKWLTHHGHGNSSQAMVKRDAADHPILRGVEPEFWLHSWLYVMNREGDPLAQDCRILLEGEAIRGAEPGGERFADREALAWTREMKSDKAEGKPQRVFYASLGHPRDFQYEPVRRLVVNAAYWCLGREEEIPASGAEVEIVGKYDPPDPH